MLDVEGAEPVLIIRPDKSAVTERPRHYEGGNLWRRLMRLEHRVRPKRSLVRWGWPETLAALPVLDCAYERQGAHSYRVAAADIEKLRAFDLDFIVAFLNYDILRGDILDVPRFGVWSYHHGDPLRFRGAPPGVWEIYYRAKRTGTVLQRLTDRLDAGIILRQDDFPTLDHSCNANWDNIHFRSMAWVAEVCAELCRGEEAKFTAPPATTDAPVRRAPTDAQTVWLFIILVFNNLRRIARRAIARV